MKIVIALPRVTVCAYLDDFDASNEDVVISDDLSEFREMPWEPFLNSHGEKIQVLIHKLEQRDGLNDVFVLSVNISLILETREGVTETQGGLSEIFLTEIYSKESW